MVVLRKAIARKQSAAFNVGANVARQPLLRCVEAVLDLKSDAILHVVVSFVNDPTG